MQVSARSCTDTLTMCNNYRDLLGNVLADLTVHLQKKNESSLFMNGHYSLIEHDQKCVMLEDMLCCGCVYVCFVCVCV